jgi:hypothetical protein
MANNIFQFIIPGLLLSIFFQGNAQVKLSPTKNYQDLIVQTDTIKVYYFNKMGSVKRIPYRFDSKDEWDTLAFEPGNNVQLVSLPIPESHYESSNLTFYYVLANKVYSRDLNYFKLPDEFELHLSYLMQNASCEEPKYNSIEFYFDNIAGKGYSYTINYFLSTSQDTSDYFLKSDTILMHKDEEPEVASRIGIKDLIPEYYLIGYVKDGCNRTEKYVLEFDCPNVDYLDPKEGGSDNPDNGTTSHNNNFNSFLNSNRMQGNNWTGNPAGMGNNNVSNNIRD